MRPSFQLLVLVSVSRIGVAPFARVSAIIFRRYQPNEYTVSCLPVITLSISSDSSPMPGIVPRARSGRVEPGGSWLTAPGVVVAELDDHEIAGAHVGEHPVPVTFGDERAAAAAAARHVHDAQFRFVEERLQNGAPALLVLGIGL